MRTGENVRAAVLACIQSDLASKGVSTEVSGDTDLRAAGLIDSLGFIRLLSKLEQVLGRPVDLSAVDPSRLTHVDTLVSHLDQH